MTKTVVLFDLGGTLVEYYGTGEFLPILEAAVQDVSCSLRERGLAPPAWDDVWQRALDENYEASDYRVRPLEDRLRRIFALEQLDHTEITICDICRTFMGPIFRYPRHRLACHPVTRSYPVSGSSAPKHGVHCVQNPTRTDRFTASAY